MLTLFLLLLAGHALCDYPLQGDFLARGKNRITPIPGVPWYQCMASHAAIHGAAVGLATGLPLLGVLEFAVHFAIDDGKCSGRYGFNADQALHVACKAAWVLVAAFL